MWILIGMGNISFIGHILRSQNIVNLGTVTVSAPLPLVFTGAEGVEDFANTYGVAWLTASGLKSKDIQSSDLSVIQGPFNRRAPYETAVGFGPYLPKEYLKSIFDHGFCDHGTLAMALKEQEPIRSYQVFLYYRNNRDDYWEFAGECP